MKNNNSQIVLYADENGNIKIDVRFEGQDVWLNQKQIAELFGKSIPTINEHIKNIFEEAELEQNSVIRNFRITAEDGKNYDVIFYNLDLIIAVGYRVKSTRGTAFRKWATSKLKEYIIKGFVLDDERLKNPDLPFDYFEELTKRIQDIRTSEKRFYRKITDIYSLSVDYDPTDELSLNFFASVQNKIHFAITGKTASEIIYSRASAEKPNMGLTNFRGTIPRKEDVSIAKNYLNEDELSVLNNLVEQYLLFAQGQALKRIPMKMQDWIEKLHGFLQLNDRDILKNAGKISSDIAKELAESEYSKFHTAYLNQKVNEEGDFEKAIAKLPTKKQKK